jgi:oxygen-independent coproporphyrinogen-3 oxidase
LYVHVPWCVRKCPYCDFNSHEARAAVPEERYVAALAADLEHALPLVGGRRVHSVFFGGGTPSLLSARALDEILSVIRSRLALAPDAEITLEANPGTLEAHKFADFRALGINRLSIGIQSFDPLLLKALGRIHDERQARAAIELAHASFENFNLDLMYGLPGQTAEQAEADIRAAIAAAPAHVSAYHLTIEPNTYFHRYPPLLPDDDACAAMQERAETLLAEAGFAHYETSAFARPGRECRHNLNYWCFGDYLGIGAGAHSKLSLPSRIFRQMRCKHPRQYMDRALQGRPVQEEHDIAVADLPFEFMMNAARLIEGVPARLFEERTGLPIAAARRHLDSAAALGLLECDDERIVPTVRGQRFLNDLLQLFLPA